VSGRLKTFLTVAETRSIQLASKVLSDAGRQFTGRVKLSDLASPNGYRLSGEGNGGLAGHAKGGATVRLFDDGKGTLMKYEAHHRRGRSRGRRAAVFPLALRPGAARDFVGFTRCGAFD
jgi:carbon monoxide dehydrogenase subunit G